MAMHAITPRGSATATAPARAEPNPRVNGAVTEYRPQGFGALVFPVKHPETLSIGFSAGFLAKFPEIKAALTARNPAPAPFIGRARRGA